MKIQKFIEYLTKIGIKKYSIAMKDICSAIILASIIGADGTLRLVSISCAADAKSRLGTQHIA